MSKFSIPSLTVLSILGGLLVLEPDLRAGAAERAGRTSVPDAGIPARMRADLGRYEIQRDEGAPGSFRAHNPQHGLRATFDPDGIAISVDDQDAWGMRLARCGRRSSLNPPGPAELVADKNRIEYRRSGIVEWYVNDARGIEQGFEVTRPPAGEGSLVVELFVTGDLEARLEPAGQQVAFERGTTRLRYDKLHSFDATGRALASRMEIAATGPIVRLIVDDDAAVYPVTIDPLLSSEKKLVAADGASVDLFGRSVAISGDTAIIGADSNDGGGTRAGAAYVFERDSGGPGNWGQMVKLLAADPTAFDAFGRSVAISGDTAIVGKTGDDDGGPSAGAAYVFERDAGGLDNWGQITKLTAADAAQEDVFGISVAISGDTAIVGAFGDDDGGNRAGAAYVFERDAGGLDNWGQVTKLTAADAAPEDQFGFSVAISGDTVIVGARYDDDGGFESGAAYVFERDAGGAGNWGEVRKLTASDGATLDTFGSSVAISGDTVIVGAHGGFTAGAAYVFERDAGGASNWGEIKKLTPDNPANRDFFGESVAISGGRAMIGATEDPDRANRAGAAYLFERDAGGVANWGRVTKLTAADAAANDAFGVSVSIDDDTAIVGAFEHDAGASDSGAAYVFTDDSVCENGPSSCVDAWGGRLFVNESSPGNERLGVGFFRGPALNQIDLGSPTNGDGTAFRLCIYGGLNNLVGQLRIDRAGGLCAGKPCWAPVGGNPPTGRGYRYRDANWSADGTLRLRLEGGNVGKSRILLRARNRSSIGRDYLPKGIAMALAGSASATIQLHGDDLPQCFSATLDTVLDNGNTFKARATP
jgi:hypothetical protein